MDSFVIFCDGACSGNPGRGGWGVAILTPDGKVVEMGGGEPHTTNNRMELTGAIEGLRKLSGHGPVDLCTDSTYVIRGITQWIWGWQRDWAATEARGVANIDLWKELAALTRRYEKGTLRWKYVRGHAEIPGNERVDEIAVAFSKGRPIDLYRGSVMGYNVDLLDIPENTELPPMIAPAAPKAAAHSYLSVVNGAPVRHQTWKECEARVKGRSGAKFKKTTSPENEREILQGWGYSAKDLKD